MNEDKDQYYKQLLHQYAGQAMRAMIEFGATSNRDTEYLKDTSFAIAQAMVDEARKRSGDD